MRVNEKIRDSVLFVGILDDAGAFVPYGTAFVVALQQDGIYFPSMVTARHVLESARQTKRPIVARVNDKVGRSQLGLIDQGWQTHPTIKNCDIVVAPCTISMDMFDLGATLLDWFLDEKYISENEIGPGDEVYTVGLLTKHFGRERNIPIVRMGNIAAMPEEPVDLGSVWGNQEVYLIESRSIGGLSGSPVFLNTPPFRINYRDDHPSGVRQGTFKRQVGHKTEYLMGVNIGLFHTLASADALPPGPADKREAFLESMSAGIAVVVPVQRILEILDTPFFKDGREDFLRKKDQKVAFVPTSAVPQVISSEGDAIHPRATDANPTHREDFKRLLNVAAQKRKPSE